MTRKRVFIAFAVAVMILVLTAALLVACGDETKTYTVTFKDGETVVKTVSVQDGATIADADLPADLADTADAAFEGWFNGDVAFDKTAAITSNVTYTAKWASIFTVTFKNGDDVIATAKVKSGEKIAAADIPANLANTADATFEGWFNGDVAFDKDAAISANVTYTAKWAGILTVTFKEGDNVIATAKVKSGEKIAAADIPSDLADKADVAFDGWFNGDVAFDKDAVISANVTYTAKWTSIYTITFKNGDEVIATAKVKSGEKIAAADIPSDLADKADVAFDGWFNGDAAFDRDAVISANVTYTAKWTSIFTVTFKNGDETVATAKVKSGAVIAAEDVPGALADTDYAFLGWFVGDFAYDKDAAVTTNIVVSARFSKILKSFYGTWKGGELDRSTYTYTFYTLIIDKNGISANLGDGAIEASNIVWNDEYATYDFNLEGETIYSFGEYYGTYTFASADYSVYATLSKVETGVVSADDTAIVGTFTTKGGVEIVVNSTFVTIDGVDGSEFYYNDRSAEYTFYINDSAASIKYDSTEGQWFYIVDQTKDQLDIASMAPAAIPAAFYGTWSNATIGSDIVTIIEINENGVYESGAKIGKVTNATETTLTVAGGWGDYTFTLADGNLSMDNGYAPIVLSKSVKVVFMVGEGYQKSIYYVAVVDAEGKIDFDTFALEDPQAEAGYTFKGWFNETDSTSEFDEDATFTQNTVFQSKMEKTGYVLTFKKSASDSEPTIVVVDKTSGKLVANQIPAALTYEDGSVFAGWYTEAGVKAVADLVITSDATFTAFSVKETDYEGYWINTESGKEALAVIADGKVTFGYGVNGIAYTFSTEDGSLSFSYKDSYSIAHSFVIIKTSSGIVITESYYDRDAEEDVSNEYSLAAPKSSSLTKKLAGTYQCSNSEIITVLENGVVTKVDGVETTYGYIGGKVSAISLTYKTGSTSSVTTKTGKYDAKSLILGGKIYVKNPSSFASYYDSSNGTFYVYTREGKSTIYTFKGTDYATIDGELTVGNIVTVTYGEMSFVAKITSASEYDVAGAERGTFTAEGKDSITFDGFGSATIGDKTYSYIVNAKNVVVITGETTLGVTLDGEAKTYAEATGDGFAHAYIDASNSKYTLTFDGFGGVEYKYAASYGTPQISYGSYALGNGTVTVSGANYSYNKTYSVEESGSVIASTDGSKVLAVAGYTIENKIEQFKGYWVNGSNSIEITLDSSNNALVSVNGETATKAKANWNGSTLTFTAKDFDNSNATWAKNVETTYTLKVVDGKLVASHFCATGFDEDGAVIFSDTATTVTYEVGSKAGDGLEGTYKSGSNVIVLDGKGNGTLNGVAFTYTGTGNTKKVSAFGAFNGSENTFTVTATGINVSFDDEYNENTFNASFTKQAEETLDAFAGTWVSGSLKWIFDGKGNVTNEDGNSFTYTIVSGKAKFSTGSLEIECTISGSTMTVSYDDGEAPFTKTFIKQA